MAKRAYADRSCSYDWSYERSRSGRRRGHLRQAASLDGRAEAQDRGRRHGAGCVGGDCGWQAWHQHRAVLCLAATPDAARSARCRSRHRAERGWHRSGDERAACEARRSCTAGAGHAYNGGRTGATRSNRTTGSACRYQMVWQGGEDCGARADCGRADRFGDTAPSGAWTYALRRFRHGDRVDRPGGRQFQGSSCSSWWLLVLPETRRSSTSVR
jgi:hypothetical protein